MVLKIGKSGNNEKEFFLSKILNILSINQQAGNRSLITTLRGTEKTGVNLSQHILFDRRDYN
jgi:hypothetical protein